FIVIPSTPATTLFLTTCLYASFKFSLSRIASNVVTSYMYVISFLSRKVGIHFNAFRQGSFSSFNRDFYNDKIIQPFALSNFHQISSLLRLLLTSRFPGLYHYNLLESISETSPVKVRTLSLHLSAIYTPRDYCSYSSSTSFAVLSPHVATYMISVRPTRGLPKASFRFPITMDTLAIGYALT